MILANLSIYYTLKNVKSACNNNKFKISAPICNDESDWPDESYSISDTHFKHIIENNPPVQIYVNKTKHRIAFKIKTSCKIELLSSETKKLLGSTKKMLIKIKTVKMYQN